MKIHRILTAFTLGIAMVFASCEGPIGALYEGEGQDVSFASTSMIMDLTSGDGEVIKVPIYRGNKNGEFTLEIESAGRDAATGRAFTLVSEDITFADGENIAYAEYSYDFDALAFGKDYYIDLRFVRKNNLSPSGMRDIEIKLSRKFATKPLSGKGSFMSGLFGGPFEFKVERATEANVYVFKEVLAPGYDLILVLNDDETQMVSFGPYETGYIDEVYGMVWVRGLTYEKSGNELNIKCQYYAPGGGTFGDYEECFTLPE